MRSQSFVFLDLWDWWGLVLNLSMLKPLEPMEEIRMGYAKIFVFQGLRSICGWFLYVRAFQIKRINLLIFDLFISGPMEEIRMVLFFFKLLQHFFKISTWKDHWIEFTWWLKRPWLKHSRFNIIHFYSLKIFHENERNRDIFSFTKSLRWRHNFSKISLWKWIRILTVSKSSQSICCVDCQ